jgi:hypothetical protein
VTEMGGTVAKKLGDGLMALFGYPAAHENDAERAARAALAELNRANADIPKPIQRRNLKATLVAPPQLSARPAFTRWCVKFVVSWLRARLSTSGFGDVREAPDRPSAAVNELFHSMRRF